MADQLPVSEINMTVEFQKSESKAAFESSFFTNTMDRSLKDENMFDHSLTSSQIENFTHQNGGSNGIIGDDVQQHNGDSGEAYVQQKQGSNELSSKHENLSLDKIAEAYSEAMEKDEFAMEQHIKPLQDEDEDDEEHYPSIEIPIIFEKTSGEVSESQNTQIPTIVETQPSMDNDSQSDKIQHKEKSAIKENSKSVENDNPNSGHLSNGKPSEELENQASHEIELEQKQDVQLQQVFKSKASDTPAAPPFEPEPTHPAATQAVNNPISPERQSDLDVAQDSEKLQGLANNAKFHQVPEEQQAVPEVDLHAVTQTAADPSPDVPALLQQEPSSQRVPDVVACEVPKTPDKDLSIPPTPIAVKKPQTESEEEEEEEDDEEFVPMKKPGGGFKLISGGGDSVKPTGIQQTQDSSPNEPALPKVEDVPAQAPELRLGQQGNQEHIVVQEKASQQTDTKQQIQNQSGISETGIVSDAGSSLLSHSAPNTMGGVQPNQENLSKTPEVHQEPRKIEIQPMQPAQTHEANQSKAKPEAQPALPMVISETKEQKLQQVLMSEEKTTQKTWRSETTKVSHQESSQPHREPSLQQQREPPIQEKIAPRAQQQTDPPPQFQPTEWRPEQESVTSPPSTKIQFQPAKVGPIWPPPQAENREGRQSSPILTGKLMSANQWIHQESVTKSGIKFGAPWARSVSQHPGGIPDGVQQPRSISSERPPPLKIAQDQSTSAKKQWPPPLEPKPLQYSFGQNEPQPAPGQRKQWPPPPEPEYYPSYQAVPAQAVPAQAVPAQAVIHEAQPHKMPRPIAVGTGFRPIDPDAYGRPMSPTPLSPGQRKFPEQPGGKWPVHENVASEGSQTRHLQHHQEGSMTSHMSRTTKSKVTRQWPPAAEPEYTEPAEGTRAQIVHTPAYQEHQPIYAQARSVKGSGVQPNPGNPMRFSQPGPQAPPKPMGRMPLNTEYRPGVPQQSGPQQMTYQAQQQHNAPIAHQIPMYQPATPKGWSPGGQLQQRQEVHNFQQGNMQGQTVYNTASQHREIADPNSGHQFTQRFQSQQQNTVMHGGGAPQQRWPPPSQH